ncbi:MAG: copper transporter [Acidimicrobiales bacterium]
MITFRYYIVTLMAVFLALGLGVLAGTTFIPPATVAALKRSFDRVDRANERLRSTVETLDRRNQRLSQFTAATRALVVRDVLKDHPVVLVVMESTPEEAVAAVGDVLLASGGRLEGSIELSDRLDGQGGPQRRLLALALEAPTEDPEALRILLVEQMAGALSGRSPGAFQRLVDASLARVRELPGATPRPPAALAAPGSAIVILSPGPRRQPGVLAEGVLAPLVRSLSAASVLVAVGEAGSERLGLVRLIRREPGLRVVTVDGTEAPVGQAALVLGLRAGVEGRFGHYGSGEGASGMVPVAGPGR